ncbi:MAG: ATP-binding protein [Gemmatimonadales bacterium]
MTEGQNESPDRLWSRIEKLSAAAVRISAIHEVDTVLQEIADASRDVIGASYAALGILGEGGERKLETFVASGVTSEQYEAIGTLPEGKGVLGLLIADPRPLRIPDISADQRSAGFPPNHPVMHSFLGVPIVGRRRPLGNLYLTEKIGAPEFSQEDEAVAVILARHAAVAVENARLYEHEAHLLSELRELQSSRERFFATVNHELRNALTAVYGWADLLVRKKNKNTPRAAIEVYECAEHTLALLDDLLDLSRIDADKLQPVVRDADASDIAKGAIRIIEPSAKRRKVGVNAVGANDPVECRTDPQRIRQILINLLTNAVRHSPEGEAVTVEIRSSDSTVRFDVVDHGEGIAGEMQASIFEAFERAGDQHERGTGLGLALSRQLARLLGGDLTVESQLGKGARFRLQVPRYID